MVCAISAALLLVELTASQPPAAERPEEPLTQVHPRDRSRSDRRWLRRWAPEPMLAELGLYAGAFVPARRHELFAPDPELIDQGHRPFRPISAAFGGRVGVYPLAFLGVEAEGGAMPSRLHREGPSALVYALRVHALAQLGLWSVTPFVLAGGGILGLRSKPAALGTDIDPAFHIGGGVKAYLHRFIMLRLDGRDVISHRQGLEPSFGAHHLELSIGLAFTLGRATP